MPDDEMITSALRRFVKLGGLAMPWNGFRWELGEAPPTSDRFVEVYRRYYEYAIELFEPRDPNREEEFGCLLDRLVNRLEHGW